MTCTKCKSLQSNTPFDLDYTAPGKSRQESNMQAEKLYEHFLPFTMVHKALLSRLPPAISMSWPSVFCDRAGASFHSTDVCVQPASAWNRFICKKATCFQLLTWTLLGTSSIPLLICARFLRILHFVEQVHSDDFFLNWTIYSTYPLSKPKIINHLKFIIVL